MPFSLAAEPRRMGAFEPYFWTRPPTHQSPHPLVPLLFPEALPTVSFIDRKQLWRTRNDSGQTTPNKPDGTFFRQVNAQLQPEAGVKRNVEATAMWSSMGVVDLAGTTIAIDDELLLLVPSSWETTSPSLPSSRSPSRPPSTVVDGAALEKTLVRAKSIRNLGNAVEKSLGRNTSIRVHNEASPKLDRKASMARRSSLPMLSPRPSLLNMKSPSTTSAADKPLRVVVQAGTVDRLVSILVSGLERVTVSASDDSGEAPLKEKTTRKLKVDREEFAKIWWNVFRSYVTPLVFFEVIPVNVMSLGLGLTTFDDSYCVSAM